MIPLNRVNTKTLWPMAFSVTVPVAFAVILGIPATRAGFLGLSAAHPYLMGFLKFALLATTGEVLAARFAGGAFAFPKGALPKAAVWGLIGMMMAGLMPVFSGGVLAAQQSGVLPLAGNTFVTALLTSAIMNITFGPVMMAGHRISDTMIDRRCGGQKGGLLEAVRAVDWAGFVGFVVQRAIPFFWIPAHTITFLLPPQWRVLFAALLGVALGIFLSIANIQKGRVH